MNEQLKLANVIDSDKISPMMKKYFDAKKQYPDCLIFCRLGDFYELFFEDAEIASKVLDITLTGRKCGIDEKAPMCGVPYHAVDSYIAKLIEKGYKVAMYDQLTEPVPGKLVEREVTRVITSGTLIETDILDAKSDNYILSIFKNEEYIGCAYCDISTGEFKISEFKQDANQKCIDLLSRIRPAEIICNSEMYDISFDKKYKALDFIPNFSKQPDFYFNEHEAREKIKKQFKIASFQGHDFDKLKFAIIATGALLNYLQETQKRNLGHINRIITEKPNDYMNLDFNACRNLELIENIRDNKKKGSLLGHLNKTKTSMGTRLLQKWILQPLQDEVIINERLDAVEELFYNPIILNDIQSVMSSISDIARICSKISYGSIMPKDCVSLKNSLLSVIDLSNLTKSLKNHNFVDLFKEIESVKNICVMLDEAFVENPPSVLINGGFIKDSFNEELYSLKHASTEAKKWLSGIEAREREETGIKNLKIGYSRIIGYYIEINKAQETQVPYRYTRKQTVSNHERFITDELKEIEEKILNSQDASIKLESIIYDKIKEQLKSLVEIIQSIANDVAYLDVISSLVNVSQDYQYVRPIINKTINHIKIENGRHPIVEAILKNESFVPNDTYIDENNDRTLIITGPNMAGKSTYMRQIALITILAHIGCFVPASSAEIPIVDRIFTRIGASDDLNNGQSTFMVEMVEVANILNNATNKSLVLLDEVGRGTSTYDGMSIAWAVLEYVSQKIRCKTLFSTHYHEITSLEGKLDGVRNYQISVKEFNNSIIFLRKIIRGSADKSFGIEVASLSGIYNEIILRAKTILQDLESKTVKLDLSKIKDGQENSSKVNNEKVLSQIKNLDINRLSPIDAFEMLSQMNKILNENI